MMFVVTKFLLLIQLFIILPNIIYAKCPQIYSRSDWNARPPKSKNPLKISPPTYIVMHHSDGPTCDSVKSCKTRVKNIQNFHMNNRGWNDIGYNFLIGGDGSVYEGRGWGVSGAHFPIYNRRSIGICLIGNFMNNQPSNNQLEALKNLISCAGENNKVATNYNLIGHRQGGSTLCPGNNLFNEISQWSHFNAHPS